VYAGDAKSNAKADFKRSNYGYAPPGAAGQAIINYDKEEQNWQVQVKVRNLRPDFTYSVEIGNVNVWGGTIIATFTTDSNGHANFHNIASDLPQTYNVARIIEGETPTEYNQFYRLIMIAQESGGWGLLQFSGTRRGE
jgi:hypothetical protein